MRRTSLIVWLSLTATSAALVACLDQHDQELMAVERTECVACHELEYIQASDPPHAEAFPPECALCHATDAWRPATFTHEGVRLPCVDCHRPDYETTSDPQHPGLYPTTCQDCHMTAAWRPALEGVHPEEAFPIERGPHEKFACTECHDPALGSSVDGANTDCIGCHTGKHELSKMNDKHDEEPDYNPEPDRPSFCLDCHPSGEDD